MPSGLQRSRNSWVHIERGPSVQSTWKCRRGMLWESDLKKFAFCEIYLVVLWYFWELWQFKFLRVAEGLGLCRVDGGGESDLRENWGQTEFSPGLMEIMRCKQVKLYDYPKVNDKLWPAYSHPMYNVFSRIRQRHNLFSNESRQPFHCCVNVGMQGLARLWRNVFNRCHI